MFAPRSTSGIISVRVGSDRNNRFRRTIAGVFHHISPEHPDP
jgi:hypothetical protein